jgi:FMS-like tyrosine kinase 1
VKIIAQNKGQKLGASCFGQVFKAEALGIVDAETVTTVAVKMVKATAQSRDALSALIRELKIPKNTHLLGFAR